MEENKISIIVPIYNVQEFLRRCIESLLNQTYKNLEILLIDDGSTDSCGKICDEYEKEHEKIRVFHKKNGGLSDARNYGVTKATGKYIAFVDSDDYVNKDYCKILCKNLEENDADISICKFKRVKEEILREEFQKEKISVYEGIDKQKNILDYNDEMNTITTVAWNKLYKRELWDGIEYPKGKINEDEFVVHYLMHKSHRVVYTNLVLYYYYYRENSIMNKKFSKVRLDAIEGFKDRVEFYKSIKEYTSLVPEAYTAYMKIIILNYFCAKENKLFKESKKIKTLYKEEYDNMIKIGIKDRMKLNLFYFVPNIYYLLQLGVRNVRENIKKNLSE